MLFDDNCQFHIAQQKKIDNDIAIRESQQAADEAEAKYGKSWYEAK